MMKVILTIDDEDAQHLLDLINRSETTYNAKLAAAQQRMSRYIQKRIDDARCARLRQEREETAK